MITCNKCGRRNEDQALECAQCGHKLQSRWSGPQRPGRRGGLLKPMGRGDRSGMPLFLRAAEVLAACGALVAALGYGLATGTWWPVYVACALALGLLALRR